MTRATLRAELLAFLADQGDLGGCSITELSRRWDAAAAAMESAPGALGERAFRQAVDRAEKAGSLRQLREDDRVVGIAVLERVSPPAVERLRQLARERDRRKGLLRESDPAAAGELRELPTPALRSYLRRREAVLRARREFAAHGMDPATVEFAHDPLGEEALMLKERVLRLEGEVAAWTRAAAALGLTPEQVVARLEEPGGATRAPAGGARRSGVGERARA